MAMLRRLHTVWTRWRFERAFAKELRAVARQRAKHAETKPSQTELQARVHDALRRKLSA